MGRRLYVGNLPWSIDNNRLKEAFAECGTIKDAKIVTDRESGQSRGFGFVEFDTDQAAADAIVRWNGQDLDGRSLTVNEAHERAGGSRPSGGGGFRGNGGPPLGGGGPSGGGGGSGRGGGRDQGKRGKRRERGDDY